MVKYLKISKENCTPCMRIQMFLDNNVPEKQDFIKDIKELEDMTEDNVLYCATVEESPHLASFFELSGVPAIIKLNSDNSVTNPNLDIRYGFDSEYLYEVTNQIG